MFMPLWLSYCNYCCIPLLVARREGLAPGCLPLNGMAVISNWISPTLAKQKSDCNLGKARSQIVNGKSQEKEQRTKVLGLDFKNSETGRVRSRKGSWDRSERRLHDMGGKPKLEGCGPGEGTWSSERTHWSNPKEHSRLKSEIVYRCFLFCMDLHISSAVSSKEYLV